jgi:hypothetical protein
MQIISRLSAEFKAARLPRAELANTADPAPLAPLSDIEANYRIGRALALEPESDIRLLDAIPTTEDCHAARLDDWNDGQQIRIERTRLAMREMREAAEYAEFDNVSNYGGW